MHTNLPHTLTFHPNDPTFGYSRNLTPHRHRKKERKVATLSDYSDVHRSIAIDQDEYIRKGYRNYVRPLGRWHTRSALDQVFLLAAYNMEARVFFAHVAVHHLRLHPELRQKPVCFVTISPRQFVGPRQHASQVDLQSLQAVTRQALSGCSLVGMVDFALFKGWGEDGIRSVHNHVGAHTHSLVFGKTKAEIKAIAAKMGQRFVDVTGGFAVHVLEIGPDKVEGYLLYLLKAPLFRYPVKEGYREKIDWKTGEVFRRPRINSLPLQPCDQLRMSGVLSDMYLDELLFGQGDGTLLVRAIRNDALAPLRRRNNIAAAKDPRPNARVAVKLAIQPEDRLLLSEVVRSPFRFPNRRNNFAGIRGGP